MTIERINKALPPSNKIEALNNQTLELEGMAEKGQYVKFRVGD